MIFDKYFYIYLLLLIITIKCCPDNWLKYKNKCFKYLPSKVNNENAINLCSLMNSTLVSIHSKDELKFLQDLARNYSPDSGIHWVWIGGKREVLNKSSKQNESLIYNFKWLDGSKFDFHQWRRSCPDKRKGEDCILMSVFQTRSPHWCNYDCNSNLDHVICQKQLKGDGQNEVRVNKTSKVNTTLPKEIRKIELPGTCGLGWTINNNYCYKFFDVNETWSNGNRICREQYNASLITITSESEQLFVQNFLFILNEAKEAVWLGAKRKKMNYMSEFSFDKIYDFSNEFVWIDNSSLTYKNYAPHEPDHRNEAEDCLAINNMEDFFGLWLDAPCNVTFSIACKKEINKFNTTLNTLNLEHNLLKEKFDHDNLIGDLVINLLQHVSNEIDVSNKSMNNLLRLAQDLVNSEKNLNTEIKLKYVSNESYFKLISFNLFLSIFISLITIGVLLYGIVSWFRHRYHIKKPYAFFSFKNLTYSPQTNNNEYEELIFNHNNSANPNNNKEVLEIV